MARTFARDERIRFENVECELALLDVDRREIRAAGRRSSRMSWSTEWAVDILEPRDFELTGLGIEAWHVAIFVGEHLMFVLPIIGAPVYAGTLRAG